MTNNDKKKKRSITMIYRNYVLLYTNSVIIFYRTHISKRTLKHFKPLKSVLIRILIYI